MSPRLISILNNKCPRCQKGDFFIHNNAYSHLREFDKMYVQCPECRQRYEPETGFYYGAMYISYGLTVVYALLLTAIFIWALNFPITPFLIFLFISIVLFTPWFYRVARRLYISIFISPKG